MEHNNSNLEPSLWVSLKVVVNEWGNSTTAHAIPNIFRNAYPSYVSTEIVQEIPANFPAVTICNIKTINKETSKSYLTSPYFAPFTYDPNTAGSTLQYILFQQYLFRAAISNDNSLNDDSRREKGFELKNMMISCFFNYIFCSSADFTYFYDPSFGNCYTFNKGVDENGTVKEIKTVTVSGPFYGLSLELYLGDPTIETEYEYNDGIIVSVHNQSAVPFTEEGKIMASAGADTDIIVSRKFTSRLGLPHSNCLIDTTSKSSFSSFYFDYIVKTLRKSYSQNYCFQLCLQKSIMNTCNCTNAYLPNFQGNNSYCTDKNYLCVFVVISDFGKNQANKDCQAACPFECNSVEYETTSHKSLYPNHFYQGILANYSLIKNKSISYDNIPKAVAKVNVFYKNMVYTKNTEIAAISTESFFSNIGGTLGLYIGISLLSLVEIIELAINIIIAVLSYSKAKSQISSNGNKIQTSIEPIIN